MGIELKPCPWCGRVPVAADISGGGPAYWVECYRCEATGPVDTSSSLDGAADAWNRRPVEDALQARAEAAEADLSALAATVGAAVVASALAPGESLSAAPQHIIVSTVNRLRARAEKAEAEVARPHADALAAAHFAQSVAHLLAPPGAEDEAVRHLRADDLPDLLAHLRERLAQARAEGAADGAARERAAVAAMLRLSTDPAWWEVARCIDDGEYIDTEGGAR